MQHGYECCKKLGKCLGGSRCMESGYPVIMVTSLNLHQPINLITFVVLISEYFVGMLVIYPSTGILSCIFYV